MSSGMRSAYETSGSALRPIFTHGAASSTSDNPESAVLLPCFSGARLTSPSRSRLLPLPAEDDVTSAVALAPRCTSALVAGRSGFAVFTPLAAPVGGDAAAPPRRPRSFRPFDNAVVAHAAYDSSGGLLAVAPATGVVHVYDCDAFHVTHAFALRQDLITTAVAFHPDPDAMLLFVGAEDGSIRCFDMATRAKEPVYVATHHVSAVVSLSFVNAGRWLVAAGKDRVLSVSKSRDGAKLHLMAANEDLVGVSALAARPATVVSAGDGGSLRVWDVAAGRELTGLATAVPLVSSSARDGGEGDGGTVENVVSGVVSCGANKFAVTLTDRTLLTFAADADGRLRAERAVCGNLEQINDLCALPSAAASAAEPDFLVASNSPVLWVVRPPQTEGRTVR
jgi:WD40 repeat protein